MKDLLRRVGRAVVAVVHDKDVQRAGKSLGALVLVRLLIAAGAAPTVVSLVQLVLDNLGL